MGRRTTASLFLSILLLRSGALLAHDLGPRTAPTRAQVSVPTPVEAARPKPVLVDSKNFTLRLEIPADNLPLHWHGAGDAKQRGEWANGYAIKASTTAESVRAAIAKRWFGETQTAWSAPVPVTATLSKQSSGATSFTFLGGALQSWDKMCVGGSPREILEDVLPHEITHALFAQHFGRPVPRWADEGAAMLSETVETQARYIRRHVPRIKKSLTGGYPHAVDRLLKVKQYPNDAESRLQMYAESVLLVRFLVDSDGESGFIRLVGRTFNYGSTLSTLYKFYGYESEVEFQEAFLKWIEAQRL